MNSGQPAYNEAMAKYANQGATTKLNELRLIVSNKVDEAMALEARIAEEGPKMLDKSSRGNYQRAIRDAIKAYTGVREEVRGFENAPGIDFSTIDRDYDRIMNNVGNLPYDVSPQTDSQKEESR